MAGLNSIVVKAMECYRRSWKVEERGGVLWNEDDFRVSACCLKEEGEDRTGVSRA
ncbi:BZ3500_MvSof-1268-A1-R1_Chr2-2g04780 [Microbotryum saponariae]|uniref:BZ3500_MvSof-1268-A1-R1_Chr2-2g04780 protein n=1 Tax=Microbotryum saponariae TaxID=289078 RepID=A0A2X0M6U3_9BASI|nr:BZ3500_MvSof-1268-A1-R1_Chr2-2g04780 [Microbotryum saponariae]SDA00150.1 BZ3501_MvSof-1269-A2-R1_Chr2-2g04454 [Microbotryum saponariae]